jgi:hypothetical protein
VQSNHRRVEPGPDVRRSDDDFERKGAGCDVREAGEKREPSLAPNHPEAEQEQQDADDRCKCSMQEVDRVELDR